MAPGSLLPLPCTVGSSGFSAGRRRNILVVLCLFTVVALYQFSAPISDVSRQAANGSTWRPDLAGLIKPPSALRPDGWIGSKAKGAAGDRYDPKIMNPDNLRIKPPSNKLLPQYHFLSLPPSDGNPWPDRPEIAQVYFSPTRPHHDPPVPEWPLPLELADADDVLHRATVSPVPWEDIYKGVNKIPGMGKPSKNPKRVQGKDNTESAHDRAERRQRQEWVERAIRHAWEGYKQWAWGSDEVKPLTNGSSNPFNGWGATLVDSLDLLLMLGWERDFALARTHVRALDFTFITGERSAYGAGDGVSIPTFETCIRYLGGFLAAYDLSGDHLMLQRGQELGDWLLGAFGTSSGLPLGRYKLGYNPGGKPAGRQVLAEAGSMLLEMTRLSQLTGDNRYFEAVQRTTDFFDHGFDDVKHPKGLFPLHISDSKGAFNLMGTYSLGGQADSYYEYLIKQHHLLAAGTKQYGKMYAEAMDTARTYLMSEVDVVPGAHLLTFGDNAWETYTPRLDHLTCFAGAMLALGSKLLNRPTDLVNADRFTESCVWGYNMTQSGVGPESLTFWGPSDTTSYSKYEDEDGPFLVQRGNPLAGVRNANPSYKGRPETIESVFYMWRITRDKKWQDKGWSMFHALVEATATDAGFAQIKDVFAERLVLKDHCESFLLAETLKYYWLLFSDSDMISLDDYVFTTEAHPLKVPSAPKKPLRPFTPIPDIDDVYDEPQNRGKPEGERLVRLGTAVQQQGRLLKAEQFKEDEAARKIKEAQRTKQPARSDGRQRERLAIPVGLGAAGPRPVP